MLMDGKPERQKLSDAFFERTRIAAEEKYKQITAIRCPFFASEVLFNTKGLDHIKFKSWNKPRSRFDQYLRLKLLHLAPEVIRRSHTVQGVWHRKEWERRKHHGKWEKVMLSVSYYEFVAVIGKVRIKVIVKEVTGGEKHFWTLIPFWKTNPVTNHRILHEFDTEAEVD